MGAMMTQPYRPRVLDRDDALAKVTYGKVAKLRPADRYRSLVAALWSGDPQLVIDQFGVDTLDAALAKAGRLVAGRKPLPFRAELDAITVKDPYPLVFPLSCAAPVEADDADAFQVGVGFRLPARTWKVSPFQYVTVSPTLFVEAEVVVLDATFHPVTSKPVSGPVGADDLIRFRPVLELRVDTHSEPDVNVGRLMAVWFDRRPNDLTFTTAAGATTEMRRSADRFDWATVSASRCLEGMFAA